MEHIRKDVQAVATLALLAHHDPDQLVRESAEHTHDEMMYANFARVELPRHFA